VYGGVDCKMVGVGCQIELRKEDAALVQEYFNASGYSNNCTYMSEMF
jgi:hypothetical protein